MNEYFLKQGLPSLVHVHISFKAGVIARWIRKNIGIPYLLTEHWTVFLEEARPRLRDLSLVNQHLISKIITEADLVLPVSNYLAKSIKRRWSNVKCEVVPNVVDAGIFYPAEKNENDKLKLIHISTLTYQKDPESLIEAVGILKKRGINFALDLIGPVSEEISSLIKRHNVTDDVNLKGEMPQSVLADLIRKSDALVLYSRYETFGCVIIEANACGVPVIVPNTQLMHEIVENNVNGVLVHPGSADALADAFEDFSINMKKFSKTDIVKITTEKYSYEKVGKMYVEIYSRYTAV